MQLIFNNPKQVNTKINFKRNYWITVVLLASLISLTISFIWGIYATLASISYLINLMSIQQTTLDISDISIEVENRNFFFKKQFQIPLHKLKSWKLVKTSSDRMELYYKLNDEKDKQLLLSKNSDSDKELITLLKKHLEENDFLKLNKAELPKDS